VCVFFDEYASDLAAQLEAILPEGPLTEPSQTAIDYLEGLHTQTQRFAQVVVLPPETDAYENEKQELVAWRVLKMTSGRSQPCDRNRVDEPSFTVVSMFAGCGGLDLGFLGGFEYRGHEFPPLGFKIIEAYENDDKAIETYKKNIATHISKKDLSSFDPKTMPAADVLIGGFPCQDFSSCGPLGGLDSPRGRLYQSLVKYMTAHRPKVVIGENVINLSRMQGGAVLAKICKDLESVGYAFQVWRLYAPDFGVPQSRTRLFIVGVRDDIPGFPQQPVQTHAKKHRGIDWAIKDLEAVTDSSVPNQDQFFLASKAKKGNGQGDEISRAGEPSYTVRANAKSRIQFHYRLHRRLTVRECARLQTFPDEFVFPHSTTTNIMQIGNAVPPMLAHTVASSIHNFLVSIADQVGTSRARPLSGV
jgi:DNA (cytosine-5)-methyltransferase 1